MKDEHILSMVVDHIATETKSKSVDAFIMVEDMKNEKIQLEKNMKTLCSIFGPEAGPKTLVIATKTIIALTGSNKAKREMKEKRE